VIPRQPDYPGLPDVFIFLGFQNLLWQPEHPAERVTIVKKLPGTVGIFLFFFRIPEFVMAAGTSGRPR